MDSHGKRAWGDRIINVPKDSQHVLYYLILPIGLNVLVSLVIVGIELVFPIFFHSYFSILVTVVYALTLFIYSIFLKGATVKEAILGIVLVTLIYALIPAEADQILTPDSDLRTLSEFVNDFFHPQSIWVIAIGFILYLGIKSKTPSY